MDDFLDKSQTRVVLSGSINNFKESTKTLMGKEYSVLPAVMMVEGAYYPYVDKMTKPTSLYFSAKDLKQSVNTWNGRPVAVNHPEGQATCNSPENYDKQWVGYVFNTEYDAKSKSLKAELWVEKSRGDFISNAASCGNKIDVSIGAFGDLVPYKGSEDYDFKMTNIVGDHLAVLPDGVGACSWKDGCGIRAQSYKATGEGSAAEKTAKGTDKINTILRVTTQVDSSVAAANKSAENIQPIKGNGDDMQCEENKTRSDEKAEVSEDTKHNTTQEEKGEMKLDSTAKDSGQKTFSMNEWLADAPEDARDYINSSIKAYGINRDRFISKIVNCKLATFCKNDLEKVKDISLLESISDLIDASAEETKPAVTAHDYQFRAGSAAAPTEDYAVFKDIDWAN